MNYIRGAISTISAPYQYYKDLPPINPATLTGAIDVIVIQRPSDSGGTELACSPFHVRFGKWQVLRPGEKKVDVSINGHPIPFNMKIGEAGEAFFVFETDGDVPEDLITSPLLQPTVETSAAPDLDLDAPPADESETTSTEQEGHTEDGPAPEEPEFLDLNALPSPPEDADKKISTPAPTPPTSSPGRPSNRRRPSSLTLSRHNSSLPSPPPSPTQKSSHVPSSSHQASNQEEEQDKRADELLKQVVGDPHAPKVEYKDGIALDVEGYHSTSHGRERSDRTIRSPDTRHNTTSSYDYHTNYKPQTPRSSDPLSHTQSHLFPESSSSDDDSDDSDYDGDHPLSASQRTIPFPRATSEPPPDESDIVPAQAGPSTGLLPVQEYSWEWGAFPQPSPMKTSFGKGGRLEGSGLGSGNDFIGSGSSGSMTWSKGKGKGKGKGRLVNALGALDSDDEGEKGEGEGRSRSVPPELEGSPGKRRKERKLPVESEDDEEVEAQTQAATAEVEAREDGVYGAGGKLSKMKSDPTKFRVTIDGRRAEFELSVVYTEDDDLESGTAFDGARGRKNRDGSSGGGSLFSDVSRIDDMEAGRLFAEGQVTFDKFVEDESIVNDPRLVVRWAGDQYLTPRDGSPIMQALIIWRDSYIRQQALTTYSRPSSPLSDEEDGAKSGGEEFTSPVSSSTPNLPRSQSEPPEESGTHGVKPPTSSSWVQWWSRSRRQNKSASTKVQSDRPELRNIASAPSGSGDGALPEPTPKNSSSRTPKDIPPAESAPALPSTPVQGAVPDKQTTPTQKFAVPEAIKAKRKFAKTLRLTSDQLKSLNLKPGANTMTFTLSTTGAIACSARIFVWDSTDLVLISDIDGTITKSDGLGHVFAMIGRDWTHLGVAKLYTDITRNGYKIMYLTSRAIGQADSTREYLKGIKQNDYQLPEGPVIMSPDRLMTSLHREVILRKPEVFKMACLRDIQRLFGEASRNPFYAGFGNRITDALSYRSVNVPSSRIFTIDSSGEVKLELLEFAGYKSSYIHMTDLVDQMFPPIHRKWAPEYTDFNYWKAPVQEYALPDFSPPSPTLSARSDTSNQSTLARLRNFSLVGTRQTNLSKKVLSSSRDTSPPPDGDLRTATLRQMSSFDRLSNTLGFTGSSSTSSILDSARRSASPESRSSSSLAYADSDDEGDDELDLEGKGRHRERRRSMTSMPGSLDDEMDFDSDEEHGHYDEEEGMYEPGDEEGDMVDDEEETFDEDLLAAGEMKNVPFL